MENSRQDEKLKREQQVPNLVNCIAYIAIVICVTFFLFYISEYYWLRVYTTQGASSILNLFGIKCDVSFDETAEFVHIWGSGFSFEVVKICSGIEAIAFISGLILATPTSWKRKVAGALFITFGIFAANILRIITTILLAMQGYDEFIYHQVVSAIFTIIFVIVFVLMIQAWIIPNFIDHLILVLVGFVRAIKGTK